LHAEQAHLAARFGIPHPSVTAVWHLYGTRTGPILQACGDLTETLAGTALPVSLVRWGIEHEWARHLDDLVCRRMMLLYAPHLALPTVEHLCDLLAEHARWSPSQRRAEVESLRQRLLARHGKGLCEGNKMDEERHALPSPP
jgi:glycerol-3-phosphate dehydrogenase